jgi:hypothetical protein
MNATEEARGVLRSSASRMSQAVPESEALLDAAFARGESAGSQTAQLLDTYGAAELRTAKRPPGVDPKALRFSSSRACW